MKVLLQKLTASCGVCVLLFFLAATSPTASGQPMVVPNITLDAPGLGVAVAHMPEQAAFQLAPDGKTRELKPNASFGVPGAPWLTVRELRFDPDPLIYNSILVQNVSAVPQTYTFGVSLPTTWVAPNLIRGSIDTSLIGTDAQIAALPNSSIYAAQIDGTTVKTLQDFPFTLTTPQQAVSSWAQFGFDLNNIPVNSSIGIVLTFTLSPGDTAAIVSDFEVALVPEPGSLALLLPGGGLLACRRQKS
jgi:hypothetical protein